MNDKSQTPWCRIEARSGVNGVTDLYIFDEIGSIFGITAKDVVDTLAELNANEQIEVFINSPGGDVFDGLAVFNALKRHEGTVNTHITGLAASIASLIAMAGDTVNMAEASLLMIHDPRGFVQGTQDDMERFKNALEKASQAMASAYANKTGKDVEEIRAIMRDETWFTADDALEAGFVDVITNAINEDDDGSDELAVAARFKMVAHFTGAPDNLLAKAKPEKPAKPGKERKSAMSKKAVTPSTSDDATTVSAEEAKAIAAKAAEDARAQALVEERERRDAIRAVFGLVNESGTHDALLAKCLDDQECDEDEAKTRLLGAIGRGASPVGDDPVIHGGVTDREKRHAGMLQVMLARAGIEEHDAQNNWNGYTLAEMARASLEHEGISTHGWAKMRMLGAAITHSTSDFPNILVDAANKSMLRGYSEAPETWRSIARTGNLSDFKVAHRAGLSEFEDLAQVNEQGEFTYGTLGDRKETIQLATYGKLFSISRQTLIDDDLNAFTEIPRKMGRAASRTVGNVAWNIITSNPLMADGVALFDATHNNLAGSGAAPSTATLDAGRTAMATQTDSSGSATALNIRPAIAFVPVALFGAMSQVINSETEIAGSQNNSRRPNYVRQMVQTVVSEARLDADSTTAWYLCADPNVFDTIEVAFLDGNQNPFMEQQMGWSIDGTAWKVRIDVGAAPLEFRTFWKNAGA